MSQGCRVCHKEMYGCCKDIMDDLQITYGSNTDINYTSGPQTFYRKFKQLDFSVASTRTLHICGGCHKDITDSMDMFTDGKYHP